MPEHFRIETADEHAEVWSEHSAAGYDESEASGRGAAEVLDPEVDFLADLAAAGPVLEFAIGTGRVAVPLRRRGLAMSGIDSSPAMLEALKAKPESADMTLVLGDMATDRVPGEYTLVYLVYNTLSNLLTQHQQVDCFRNAARHLGPGGAFVIDLGVPDLRRLPPGSNTVVFDLGPEHAGIDEYDVVNQRMVSHHYRTRGGRCEAGSGRFRYAWPAELDLMARIAGMHLTQRWADWHRTPFTAESRRHISVWIKD